MRVDKAEAHASAAHTDEGRRNLSGSGAGAEAGSGAAGRTKPEAPRWMEAVVERSNMLCAYERVVGNEGAPGVDGRTVAELKPWLKAHWAKVRQARVGGRVHAGGGAQGGHTEAARRGTNFGHSDGVGSADPTSVASGDATAVRTRVFRVELRLSSRTQRAAGGGSRPELRGRREAMGRGLGEVLRCARISPALSAGEIPAPERGLAAPPGIESWTHEGNDMS